MNNRERIIFVVSFLAIALSCCDFVLAETEGRWWSAAEKPGLNVAKDLKMSIAGKNYYVDGNNGDDEKGDGSMFAPWKTISKAFDYYGGRPAPGDAILIKSGVYRERISIRLKGNVENPIIIGPYGDGEVIIDASDKVDGWQLHKDKIFKVPCPFLPVAVVMDEEPFFPEFSIGKLNKGKWYYDANNKMLYIYVDDGQSPDFHNIGVIGNDEYQYGIFLDHADYVTIYGLTIRYTGGHGISILGYNNIIEKCDIKFNGKAAISIWPYMDTKSANNKMIKNHMFHNMLRNWPRGRYKRGDWAGAAGAATDNNEYVGNIIHRTGGEGLVVGGKNCLVRDNIVYDNWSVNIYLCSLADSIVERNLVFCHEPNRADLYNNGDENPGDNKNFRRLRAEGIMTADEASPATLRNVKIINNIIIGCRRGITHYGKAEWSGLKDVLIANNTIIVPDAQGVGEEFVGINIPYNNGNNKNTLICNNIIYGAHPNTHLLFLDTGLSIFKKEFRDVSFTNNLWYHASNNKPFRMGPKWLDIYAYNFGQWQKECMGDGRCSGDIYADPEFTNWEEYSAKRAYLKLSSPVVGKAIPNKEVKDDYFGNLRDPNNPDIGAIEATGNE